MKTNRFFTILLFSLGLAAVRQLQAAATDQTVRLSGKVLNPAGQPLEGAEVELFILGGSVPGGDEFPSDKTVKTKSDGSFELQAPAGPKLLFARKAGFAPAWSYAWRPTGDMEEELVLSKPGSIAGLVTDEAEKPVADAVVWLTTGYSEPVAESGRSAQYVPLMPHRKDYSAKTGPDGRFRLENCPTNAAFDFAVKAAGMALKPLQRPHIGPDTMRWRPGQKDLTLVLVSAGTVEGKVRVEKSGAPAAKAKLVLQPDYAPGVIAGAVAPAVSEADGRFKFTEVPPATYQLYTTFDTNAPQRLVGERLRVKVEGGRVTRDLEIAGVEAGTLEVTLRSKEERKPLPEMQVSATMSRYASGAATDQAGRALLVLLPGEYSVAAQSGNARATKDSVKVEPNSTNRVELEIEGPRQITGTVRDPNGKPAAGLALQVMPEWRANVGPLKTDENGRFSFPWSPRTGGSMNETCSLVARDVANNLAVAEDLEDETRTLELKLQPGLSLAGSVQNTDGKPLKEATVQLFFWSGNSGHSFDNKPVRVDSRGKFQIKALPPGRRYSLSATAKGYGSAGEQVNEPGDTRQIDLNPFVLNVADRKLAGQVLDAEDKPVANAWIHMYGQGQPNHSARSDDKGLFKFDEVVEGWVQLSASTSGSYGSARAEAGDTNVVVKLGVQSYSAMEAPSRPSLKGKALPSLTALGLPDNCAPEGKPLLLCLLDVEQRPSRRFAALLTEQHEQLKQALTILAVQAVLDSSPEAVKDWKESSKAPYQFGIVSEKSDATKWARTVESFPWLILVDSKRTVLDEGFGFEELSDKLAEHKVTPAQPANLRLSR